MTLARLILEDGGEFIGEGIGDLHEVGGEVIFNTSMTGYQEILTDPSYSGQIITMTYPLIGNYGINPDDFEAERPYARGLIVSEVSTDPSNWRSKETLDSFMKKSGLMGLTSIDTRALTRRIRSHGAMRGLITLSTMDTAQLVEKVKNLPTLSGQDFVSEVSSKEISVLPGDEKKIALLDLGAKKQIAQYLHKNGAEVTIYPANTSADLILAGTHDGLIVSNGPGDPKDLPYVVETIRRLIGKLPIFGICLGHQLIGLALGGDTYKLKFGHRGGNYPVKDLSTGKVNITSQNHGYAVKEGSLDEETIEISHRNVNDGTIEGFRHKTLPIRTVQYLPEIGFDPMDSPGLQLFKEFCDPL